jgi:N-dimethylarginine dimethylaminohydrolase
LKSVLLHRPGRELEEVAENPTGALMRSEIDPPAVSTQHDALAQLYRSEGIDVFYVEPPVTPPPNQLFAADLFVMTPEGAIIARPASAVRAGEERWVARALADLGIPIIRSVGGGGTFEGADLMWLAPDAALVAEGLRTNTQGANQVEGVLKELGVRTFRTQLPPGTMHLMGQLRILDRELAIGWPGRLPEDAVDALGSCGFEVVFLPDDTEAQHTFAFNFVVLRPREIVMPSGNPQTQRFYEDMGITCHTVEVGEIGKAAGSIGCLTGILERERSAGA